MLAVAAGLGAAGAARRVFSDRLRQASADSDRFWELSSSMLCVAGFDGHFRRLNPAWMRTLGWTEEELRSRPFIEFVHPEDRERTAAETASLADEGYRTVDFENRYQCKDGNYRALVWSATSLHEEGLIYAMARDRTAAKQAEDELRSSERFLSSVLENLPNMVFVKDAKELRFLRFNRAGELLLGTSREELIGKSDYDLFPAEEADFFVRKDREVLASGEVLDIPQESIETASNGARILHTRKISIADEDGKPRYLLGISDDITDRNLAERAAEAARDEAERANRAKSEFLSRMSHELRTPLNAVIGFGQLLELDDLDQRQREGVEQILKGGRHLLELINEVLDISRIESGTMTMSVEPVHLGSVLAEALSLIRPLADDAQVRLTGDPSELAEVHVRADQQRLKQVLINLLSNAVKYNRPGGEVRVGTTPSVDGRVEVAVADTGHGMTAEQLERLFDPFDRLGAESGEVEGTGLGMPLSIGLMEAMGGTIRAESEPGAGTTMRVELPAAPAPLALASANGEPKPEHLVSEDRTIVYVEDNLSNLKLVEQTLERLPAVRLIPAMYGQLGFELARQHRPDMILLDLHLPDLHGHEVLERLKTDAVTRDIPVVVVSADATRAQVERLLAAGAAEYLTKPIDVERLLGVVAGNLFSATPG
jgi:PAS domain S-box-containing protein